MKKVLATVVTCSLIGISIISSPMSVEAVSSVSVESKDGNYSTMGFGGTFYEMEEAVNERLSEGPDNPIWFIASENCHTEAEYHFSTDKEKKDLAWEYNWVESDSKTDVRRPMVNAILSAGYSLLMLKPMDVTLEDIFLQLTSEDKGGI